MCHDKIADLRAFFLNVFTGTMPHGRKSGSAEGMRRGSFGFSARSGTLAAIVTTEKNSRIIPVAPSGLTVSVTSTTSIHLSWTDISANETSFRIERSPDGSAGTRTPFTYMVMIHAADDSFEMGDGPNGPNGVETISYDFSMSKYEITNAEFKVFIDDEGYSTSSYWTSNGLSWKGDTITEPFYWENSSPRRTQPLGMIRA